MRERERDGERAWERAREREREGKERKGECGRWRYKKGCREVKRNWWTERVNKGRRDRYEKELQRASERESRWDRGWRERERVRVDETGEGERKRVRVRECSGVLCWRSPFRSFSSSLLGAEVFLYLVLWNTDYLLRSAPLLLLRPLLPLPPKRSSRCVSPFQHISLIQPLEWEPGIKPA